MKHLILILSLSLFIFFSAFSQIHIDSIANVGIGTANPATKLNVNDAYGTPGIPDIVSTGIFRIGVSNIEAIDFGKIGTVPYAGWIQVGYNGTTADPLSLQPSGGNVGIGTITPTTKLDVNGKLRVRDVSNDNNKDSVLVVSGDGTVSYRDASTFASTTYSIGDFAQGGIVFWVDETGEHGLVCAKSDQSTGVRWYAGTYGNTQAKGDGPFSGEANTAIIIAAQVAIGDDGATYAARICNELQVTESGKTYGDWYLPSREELNQMYLNRVTINSTASANSGSSFANSYYWSSKEVNNNDAWEQSFSSGYQYNNGKDATNYVRAVRAF